MDIKIKSNWESVTISEYIQIKDIIKSDIESDTLLKIGSIMSILTNSTLDEVMNWKLDIYNQVVKYIGFVNTEVTPSKIKKVYEIGGKLFIIKDIKEFNTRQYIDLVTIIQHNHKNIFDNIHKILSTLLIPAKESNNFFGKKYVECESYGKYDIKDVEDYILDNMSIVDSLSIMNFFLKSYEISMLKSVKITKKKIMMMKSIMKIKTVLKIGRTDTLGLSLLTELVKELDVLGKKCSKKI